MSPLFSLQFWTFAAEPPSSAFHQKWQAAHFSRSSSSSRFPSSQVRSAAGSAPMRRASLPRERSWSLRAIEHCRCVLVALGHGSTFRRKKLALFLLPRCEFPVVCYSQALSRALSRHNKSLFTRKLPLHLLQSILPADLISASESWPRSGAIDLDFWSPKFWYQNFHPKVRFSFLWPICKITVLTPPEPASLFCLLLRLEVNGFAKRWKLNQSKHCKLDERKGCCIHKGNF